MSQHIGNLRRKTITKKKNKIKIIDLKSTVINTNNSTGQINRRHETAENRISKIRNRVV